MPGTLYVVSTPIGNLGDLTPRAAETFAQVGFVAAEDTRVTLRLLNHLGLKKPMLSYHKHSGPSRTAAILARILAGEDCALCSDAGTPAISDPGEDIVADALAQGIRVVPVPAASAAIAALSVAGRSTGRFVFEGFLPQNKRQRRQRLADIAREERTVVLYEAPHKLPYALADLAEALGDERALTICRELTKLHEEIWQTTLGEATRHYEENAPKGEFVLVLAGRAPQEKTPAASLEEAVQCARALVAGQQLSASEAARRAAKQSGQAKSDIYRAMQTHGAAGPEEDR
ncbi:MAG: 16S rRNA (cytidine(1402)-2'-O)-methyltransferase [Oscillospiraceae bacterium]|jgi:16S rRNA (cytidine1402-2'-O)-methyltransferase